MFKLVNEITRHRIMDYGDGYAEWAGTIEVARSDFPVPACWLEHKGKRITGYLVAREDGLIADIDAPASKRAENLYRSFCARAAGQLH